MKRQSGLTLIEVVAVATLTVLVAIGAMRLLTIFADETNFATRLSIDSRQADYSRMIGVVQDIAAIGAASAGAASLSVRLRDAFTANRIPAPAIRRTSSGWRSRR